MATRILMRRDTAAAFSAANPVLSAGEPAFTTDTKVFKIGDGATAWDSLPSASGATSAAFELLASSPEFSHVGFSAVNLNTNDWLRLRRASSGAQNDEVVFRLPSVLEAGTWKFALLHSADVNSGIYTIAASADGTSWTDVTTIDGYAASTTKTRSVATGLTVPAGTKYLRLKMATKNASSSSYFGVFNHLSGVRTGA